MGSRESTENHYHMVEVLGAVARGSQVQVRLACGHHYLYTPINGQADRMVKWYNTNRIGARERCTRCYKPYQ